MIAGDGVGKIGATLEARFAGTPLKRIRRNLARFF